MEKWEREGKETAGSRFRDGLLGMGRFNGGMSGHKRWRSGAEGPGDRKMIGALSVLWFFLARFSPPVLPPGGLTLPLSQPSRQITFSPSLNNAGENDADGGVLFFMSCFCCRRSLLFWSLFCCFCCKLGRAMSSVMILLIHSIYDTTPKCCDGHECAYCTEELDIVH
ncbi:hypothetical protein B0T25DRAFT_285139 [Lasiosphaeria hispida]|uniref:Uncharacterized protein n=1 Tax=Lasiosphaeria hispida TaxID=260671 RepID=A0AAJ0MB22_9PEZI|nr:hypothetical protein B0T25DRAFT_285139 [Lasiosphaeria hispida]